MELQKKTRGAEPIPSSLSLSSLSHARENHRSTVTVKDATFFGASATKLRATLHPEDVLISLVSRLHFSP